MAGCRADGVQIEDGVLKVRDEVLAWLRGTPAQATHFGMVHGDLERTNFVLNDAGLGVFDFDDCCQHWFCWDIACALWVFRNDAQDKREAFLGWFLEEYGKVRDPDLIRLERFSELVRLRTVALLLYRSRVTPDSLRGDWARRTQEWLATPWSW